WADPPAGGCRRRPVTGGPDRGRGERGEHDEPRHRERSEPRHPPLGPSPRPGHLPGPAPVYFFPAKPHKTPPCGTAVLVPRAVSSESCMRCASTPQPDWTAMYCTPSTAKELGTAVMPELVRHCHTRSPVLASKARK